MPICYSASLLRQPEYVAPAEVVVVKPVLPPCKIVGSRAEIIIREMWTTEHSVEDIRQRLGWMHNNSVKVKAVAMGLPRKPKCVIGQRRSA